MRPKQRRAPRAAVGRCALLPSVFCFEQKLTEEEETIHLLAAETAVS